MTTDTPRTDAKEKETVNCVFEMHAHYGWKFARQLERELAEANANAPWLSAAHALCSDMRVPQGNISERLEALRDVVMEARKDAERYNYAATHGILMIHGWSIAPVGRREWDKHIDAAIAKGTK